MPLIRVDPPDVELANGTVIVNRGTATGHGILVIQNGTDRSAVVKLVDRQRQPSLIYEVFIQKHQDATLSSVAPDSYELWFCFGRSWDSGKVRFLRDREANKALSQIEFEETHDEAGTRYVRQTITLHRVFGGNLHAEGRSAAEFDQIR